MKKNIGGACVFVCLCVCERVRVRVRKRKIQSKRLVMCFICLFVLGLEISRVSI